MNLHSSETPSFSDGPANDPNSASTIRPPSSFTRSQYAGYGSALPWIVLLVLVISAAYARILHYATDKTPVPNDFIVYYIAAKIAAIGHPEPLYYAPQQQYSTQYLVTPTRNPGTLWDQTAAASGLGPTLHFVTPPFVALLLEPLSHLSWPRAYKVWCWLTSLMVFASIYLIMRLANASPFWPSLAVAVAAGFAFFPYIQTIWYGQMDALILITWTMGAYLWSKQRSTASAFFFALGTMVKLMPVLAVGVFFVRRQWRWLVAYGFWIAVLLGVSIWRLGLQNHLDWLHRVYPTLACGAPYVESRSLPSFLEALYFRRVFIYTLPSSIPTLLCWVTKMSGGAIYLGVLYWFWKKNRDADHLAYELAVMPVVALIVTPMIGRHYFLFALLPLGYLWTVFLSRGRKMEDLRLLALVTLWYGIKMPEYLLLKVRLLSLLLMGSWVAMTLLFLWLCLKSYDAASTSSHETLPAMRSGISPLEYNSSKGQ
jgi:Glycosyltransferase family 87